MTSTTPKTYLIGIVERAIAYYKVEANDARTAAENWEDGEFRDRDDEALESEGPCNVRVEQPDGSWRKLPTSEWDAEAPAPVAAINACEGIPTLALEGSVAQEILVALERAEFLMRRVGEGDHRALENLPDAVKQAAAVIAKTKAAGVPTTSAEAPLRLRQTLEDVAEWLETGMIDGVHFDEASVLADIRETLAPALSPTPAIPPTSAAPGNKLYSVLLHYPDYLDDTGYETYYAWVEASDPIQAVALAQREAVVANECAEIDDPTDFHPLLVTAGHHDDQPLYNG